MKKSLRNLLIFLGIAVLLFALYFIFFQKGQTPAPQSTSSLSSSSRTSAVTPLAASGTNTAGNQLLALLGRVSSLTLNDDILANPSFDLLQDISITLPAIDVYGRRNPFAPIGTGNPAVTSSTSIQTTTPVTGTGSSSVTPNP